MSPRRRALPLCIFHDQGNKPVQEARLAQLVDEHQIDLMILARYMQILSDDFCRPRPGCIINIHHSFLPSFKGANPIPRRTNAASS